MASSGAVTTCRLTAHSLLEAVDIDSCIHLTREQTGTHRILDLRTIAPEG
jgi:hypothetical protein